MVRSDVQKHLESIHMYEIKVKLKLRRHIFERLYCVRESVLLVLMFSDLDVFCKGVFIRYFMIYAILEIIVQ